MVVSLLFSLNVYRISTYEVDNRLSRQVDFLNTRPFIGPGFDINPFERERQSELSNSKRHVIGQLLYANMLVLLVGGLGSYLLARLTIKPIEEAHLAQARFAADASHELRTPIAAMRTETEVALLNPKLSLKEAQNLLKSNVEELDRLTILSEGLLQLARGVDDVTTDEVVAVRDIVSAAITQTARATKAKHITIDVQTIPNVSVTGNSIQLVQLLVILLDNAVKYSPEKQTVTLGAVQQHGHIALSVSDHGIGIGADDLEHVFERFYRADTARSKANASGYGLGLSIAEQIASAHHGFIQADSTLGAGSVFTITLPVHEA
jgi:signal transduction histidine kinase